MLDPVGFITSTFHAWTFSPPGSCDEPSPRPPVDERKTFIEDLGGWVQLVAAVFTYPHWQEFNFLKLIPIVKKNQSLTTSYSSPLSVSAWDFHQGRLSALVRNVRPFCWLRAIPMMDHDNPGNPLNKKLAQGESLHLMIKKTGASECSIVFRWSFPLKTPGSRSPWRWAPSMDWKFPLGTWGIKCRVQYKIQPWHLWKTTEPKRLDVETKELTVNF